MLLNIINIKLQTQVQDVLLQIYMKYIYWVSSTDIEVVEGRIIE